MEKQKVVVVCGDLSEFPEVYSSLEAFEKKLNDDVVPVYGKYEVERMVTKTVEERIFHYKFGNVLKGSAFRVLVFERFVK